MIDIIVELISGLIKGVFGLLWDIIVAIFNLTPKRKELLDSDFMPASELLKSNGDGFSLNGNKHISAHLAYQSAMILGSTGQGKSVSVCIPTILNLAKYGHSCAIHDPNGELYTATAGNFASLDYNILVKHYSRPEISDGYNYLTRAIDTSGLQKVASLLIRSTLGEGSKDPFWNTQSVLLLTLIFRVLKYQDPKFHNLTNVKYLLDSMASDPEAMDILVAHCADNAILNEYKQFLVMDKKLFTSISSTCRAGLAIFSDPTIQRLSSFDSISFESFRKKKTVLFIQNKTGDLRYYAPLSALFFEQFFSYLMEKFPEKEDKSIFFIIDEASSLYLPTLQIALSNLRKFRCGIMCVAQDYNQFIHLYGSYEAEAIRTNCFSKVYFPGQPLNTCTELERILGNFQFEVENGTLRTRALMTADEIRTMDPNTSLIISGSNRAIYTKMYPYFKNGTYKRLTELVPPTRQSKVPFTQVPLISLPKKPKNDKEDRK